MASLLAQKEDLIKVALTEGIQYLPSPDMTETPLQFANDIKNKDSINIILTYLSSVSNTYASVDKEYIIEKYLPEHKDLLAFK